MSAAKELFLKNKDLRSWWNTVIEDERFQVVLLHARSEFLDTIPSKEGLDGGKNYESILVSIGEAHDAGSDVLEKANPGLEHFADQMPEKPKRRKQ